jgi:hypothetical protein
MLSYPIDELVISNLTRILTFGHYEGIKRSLFVQDDTNSTRMTAVSPVFQDLASLGLDFSSSYDQGTRRHLLDKACTLWSNLETPRNASNGHCWVQVRKCQNYQQQRPISLTSLIADIPTRLDSRNRTRDLDVSCVTRGAFQSRQGV